MADRYQDRNLSRVLTTFATQSMGLGGPFIADQLMPVVKVNKATGKYYVFQTEGALKDDIETLRAPGGISKSVKRSYSEADYHCPQHGLHENIPFEEMDEADRSVVDPERDAMTLITRKLRLGIECRVYTALTDTGTIPNGAASAKWDGESADIEGDIDAAKLAIRKTAGVEPNTVVFPPQVSVVAKKETKIRDLVKYTNSDLLVNGELPPKVFGLKTVIPMTIKDAKAAGISTTDFQFLWNTESALVAYIEREAPSRKSMSLGYQFRKPIGGAMDVAGFRYLLDPNHATCVEGMIQQTERIVCAACGYLITDTLT